MSYMQYWDTPQRNSEPKPSPETLATNKQDSQPLRCVTDRDLHTPPPPPWSPCAASPALTVATPTNKNKRRPCRKPKGQTDTSLRHTDATPHHEALHP